MDYKQELSLSSDQNLSKNLSVEDLLRRNNTDAEFALSARMVVVALSFMPEVDLFDTLEMLLIKLTEYITPILSRCKD